MSGSNLNTSPNVSAVKIPFNPDDETFAENLIHSWILVLLSSHRERGKQNSRYFDSVRFNTSRSLASSNKITCSSRNNQATCYGGPDQGDATHSTFADTRIKQWKNCKVWYLSSYTQ